jgi:hypothetical protein
MRRPSVLPTGVCREQATSTPPYSLYDVGTYPEPPLGGRITWQVTQPWVEPAGEKEQEALKKAKELIERLRARGGR